MGQKNWIRMMIEVLLPVLVLASVASSLVRNNQPIRKKLAGSADEFNFFNLPIPTESAIASDSFLLPIYFTQEKLEWSSTVPIDSNTLVTMTIFSPLEKGLNLKVQKPGSEESIPIEEALADENDKIKEYYGIDGVSVPSTTYLFVIPVKGLWKVIVTTNIESYQSFISSRTTTTTTSSIDPPSNLTPAAYLLIGNDSPIKTHSFLTNYSLLYGKQTGIIARLFNEEMQMTNFSISKGHVPSPLLLATQMAELDLTAPNGKTTRFSMSDDGFHSDELPLDGVFGVNFTPNQVGYYHAQVTLAGIDAAGDTIYRTGQHLFYVTEDTVALTGTANGRIVNGVLQIDIDAQYLKPALSEADPVPSYKVWGQIWGKGLFTRKEKAVGWVGGIYDLVPANPSQQEFTTSSPGKISVEINLKWALKEAVTPPYSIRNLRIVDRSYSIPLEIAAKEIPIKLGLQSEQMIQTIFKEHDHQTPVVVTPEMKYGAIPQFIANASAPVEGKLVLVHGYCAKSLPWPSADFTNAVQFDTQLSKNLLHDKFAQEIHNFAQANGITAFSAIGHSQGGPALTHLLSFYNSGLDLAVPLEGRVIQSLGSPYQGTPIAGNAARLGELFGVGCGPNFDLAPDGAKLWLSIVPPDVRQHVSTYITQYNTGSFLNYCNLAVNIAGVRKPNDGCTEVDTAGLEGSNFLGTKKGWCHTTGMNHPAQYTDVERNRQMDADSVF